MWREGHQNRSSLSNGRGHRRLSLDGDNPLTAPKAVEGTLRRRPRSRSSPTLAQWTELDRRISAFDAEFVRWVKEERRGSPADDNPRHWRDRRMCPCPMIPYLRPSARTRARAPRILDVETIDVVADRGLREGRLHSARSQTATRFLGPQGLLPQGRGRSFGSITLGQRSVGVTLVYGEPAHARLSSALSS